MEKAKSKRLDEDVLNTVLQTLREFAGRSLPLEKKLAWDHEDHCPEKEIRELMGPDIGLHLLFIPEEYGGLGGSPYDIYRLCDEFARIDLGVATALLAVSLGSEPITAGGTPEQKKKWLGRVAEESLLVAYSVTEPEAGSNVEALKTRAEPVPGADGKPRAYRISGVKQFISNGGIADLYTVLAKAPGGPSFFVVERGAPGLSVGKTEDKHGIRLSNTAQVVLEDVEVPAENLLGLEEGNGIKHSNKVFGYTRVMVAALGLGGGTAALERAVAYAKERKQFGGPLSEKQGYMFKLVVPHAVRLEAARAYIEEVCDALEDESLDLHVEGSVSKLFATEAGNAAAEAAIQALGGYGYCREYEVEKIKRDVRILPIYEGTNEIQQNIIGLFRMRTNVKSKGAFYGRIAEEMDALQAKSPDIGAKGAALSARLLDWTTVQAFRTRLSRQQQSVFVMADAAADAETAAALCRRAAKAGSGFLKAAARIWSAESASANAQRILSMFLGADILDAKQLAELKSLADESVLQELIRGRWADMDHVARELVQR